MLGSGLMPKELNELSIPDLPHYPSISLIGLRFLSNARYPRFSVVNQEHFMGV